jgi:hypothetical protein
MADIAPLIEDVVRRAASRAIKHRVGVDNEVVVLVVVERVVGEEHTETFQPPSTLDVACDHAERTTCLLVRGIEERHERRRRHHCFDAGDQLGLSTVLDDLQRYSLHHLVERRTAKAGDQPDEIREH